MDENKIDTSKISIAEYSALRNEIEKNITAIHRTDEICLIAWGGILTWFFSAKPVIPDAAFLLPSALTALLFLRRISIEKSIDVFHSYLLEVERRFNHEGWEHFIHPIYHSNKKRDPITRWSWLYYGCMCVFGFSLYIYVLLVGFQTATSSA